MTTFYLFYNEIKTSKFLILVTIDAIKILTNYEFLPEIPIVTILKLRTLA